MLKQRLKTNVYLQSHQLLQCYSRLHGTISMGNGKLGPSPEFCCTAWLTRSLTRLTREKIHMHHNSQKDAARSCEGSKLYFMLHCVWRLGYGLVHLINLILAIQLPTVNLFHHSISLEARSPSVTEWIRASNLLARCVPLFYKLRKGGVPRCTGGFFV